MNYDKAIAKVSRELNLPSDIVDKVYKAYWLSIRNHIKSLPLKDNLTENNFSKLRTNFNIPSLGKLSCNYDRFLGIKKRFDLINHIKEKNKNVKD